VILVIISAGVAFSYNALSDNGIDPLRGTKAGNVSSGSNRRNNYGVTVINLEETLGMMEEGAVVIDARTRKAYEKGHIPGAVLFDYYMFNKYVDLVLPQLDPTQKTIIYCSSPSCGTSELLARELYSLGYENLHVFRGGFSTWEEQGYPVEGGMR